MAREKLTALEVKSLAKPGRYGDGGGLWLQVRSESAKSWLYRYVVAGRERQLGLGPYPAITLKAARELALDAQRLLLAGRDPIAERRAREAEEAAKSAAMNFRAVAALYIAAHEETWRNPKHRAQWRATLETYVFPVIGDAQVAAVDVGAVMKIVEPIWRDKPETASRVRGRIETVLDYATARGWRAGDNPARWRGHIENLLPRRDKVRAVEHHAALPWKEIGAFMAQLAGQPGAAAEALRFVILTACRTTEAIEARWQEVDLREAVWTIPASRMKAGREQRVPLADAAVTLLSGRRPENPAGDAFVFPGAKAKAPLSNMAMTALLRRMGRGDLTVHGFRSTFRDWCAEATNYPRELAEAALAHTLKDKTEAAYQRGDLLERRRRLMADWAAFCARSEPITADVLPIRQAAG